MATRSIHDDEANELHARLMAEFETLDRSIDSTIAELDRLRQINVALLAALKAFVALYDGTRDMLGASVRAKLHVAELAIQRAEVPHD